MDIKISRRNFLIGAGLITAGNLSWLWQFVFINYCKYWFLISTKVHFATTDDFLDFEN